MLFVILPHTRRIIEADPNMTAAVFVRRLKLSRSALMLCDENVSVLKAAPDWGFGSVDGYQRALRKEFGCNPKEYSASPIPVWLFAPYLLMENERKVRNMSETRKSTQEQKGM